METVYAEIERKIEEQRTIIFEAARRLDWLLRQRLLLEEEQRIAELAKRPQVDR